MGVPPSVAGVADGYVDSEDWEQRYEPFGRQHNSEKSPRVLLGPDLDITVPKVSDKRAALLGKTSTPPMGGAVPRGGLAGMISCKV